VLRSCGVNAHEWRACEWLCKTVSAPGEEGMTFDRVALEV